jgi:glycosyltransferase involved in cell wall biosynthesis
LKVLFFGIYSKGIEYPRNNNMIRALKECGHDVYEAHYSLAGSFSERIGAVNRFSQRFRFLAGILTSYGLLAISFFRQPPVDAIIVGSPGYFHVHWAWLLKIVSRRKAVFIYDAFIPLYEAVVEDRQLISHERINAQLIRRFERSCCHIADGVLVDTHAHGNYLAKAFGIDRNRITRIFVGSTIQPNDEPPTRPDTDVFDVLFVGTYIPLHGIDFIIEAAHLLRNDSSIRFTLVGSGQLRRDMERLADKRRVSNIHFLDWVATDKLYQFIRSFDLSLGIFGMTTKTPRVIPSKIYDICKAGVPFITSRSPAVEEVFVHGENAYLIPPGDAASLAKAIQYLKANPTAKKRIADGAKQTGRALFSHERQCRDLLSAIRML